METVFISLERMQELAQNPGLAFVLKEGRWKYSMWETYKSRLQCPREKT